MEPTQPAPENINPVSPTEPQPPVTSPTPEQTVSPAASQSTSTPVGTELNPAATQPTTPVERDPGQTLGLISVITAVIGLGVVGLITGIIAKKKSKAAGYKHNILASIGVIISIVEIIVVTFGMALLLVGSLQRAQENITKCKELGPGTHQIGSVTYTCKSDGSGTRTTN